jgi:polar amino acid transport system substrate-binding protein
MMLLKTSSAKPSKKHFCFFPITCVLLLLFCFAMYHSAQADDGTVIVVGGNRDYPPYEFIDKDGTPAGYNVDLTNAIANVMGLKVTFKLGTWSDMRYALDKGEVDVLQGMSYSEGRSKVVDFSIPHTVVNHSIYARKGTRAVKSLSELEGKEVAFHGLGFIHDYFGEINLNEIPVLTDTPAGALQLIASGKPDYAVVASLPATYLIKEYHLDNIVPVAKSVVSVRYCYGVRKGNLILLARINEGLAILKQNGQYQAIYDKWLGVLEPTGVPWGRIIRYGSALLAIFFIALAGSLLWSRILKKQVAIRTTALEQEVQERKRAVEELRLRQLQLIQADKMASLGILVSGVAHEINNPNALILLNIPLAIDFFTDTQHIIDDYYTANGDFMAAGLQYSRLKPKLQSKLLEIQESSRKIKRIVEDLKDFARRDESDHSHPVDLNNIVKAAVRLVEITIHKSTCNFSEDYFPELPGIRGNAQRIEQVVVNLMLNACQALRSCDESIVLATKYNPDRHEVILEISDEGEGIAEEDIPHLTDPFFTTKRQLGGTGLGLSVSAGIIKEHQGSLEFKSEKGRGTTVTIHFPEISGEADS